jgi:uncharacterized SAM-binding protein YcdF (DUF218 family)
VEEEARLTLAETALPMLFLLSKTIGFILLPSNFVGLIGVIGAAMLFTRFTTLGRGLVLGSLSLFLLVGVLPLGSTLLYVLENRFPPWSPAFGTPDGIIVLGGAIDPDVSAVHGETALNDAAERLVAAVDLARRYPSARIVYSGGSAPRQGAVEADYATRVFESFGIARDHIILERRSRTTAENAAFTKQLVHPKAGEHWLLVTSGYHMPRAIGTFRKAGFPVEAYPVDWRIEGPLTSINTLALGLINTDIAMHEWAGLLVYWLSGRSSELFPGPT